MSEGYYFVPRPPPRSTQVRRVERSHVRLDQRVQGTWSGRIEIVFIAEQPVHIGAGLKALRDGKPVRRALLVRGVPGIPGSSMKGALRSRFEAITRSCIQGAPNRSKVRSQTHGNATAELSDALRREDLFQHCSNARMCPACALFGMQRQRSRVTVTDFAADPGTASAFAEVPEPFGPNLHHVGRYSVQRNERARDGDPPLLLVHDLKGRKFAAGRGPIAPNARWQTVETIPAGARLRGDLRVLNLLAEELGGLLSALGRLPASAIKIGGAKAHGLGRIRIETIDVSHLQAYLAAGAQRDESHWYERFLASDDIWDDGRRRLVEIHQGDC